MQHLAPLIKDLAIILGTASIVALVFQKIRQPIVLGYLIAGLIVGPYTPPHHLIEDIPNIKILSELGVIFLMFALGLEFSFHQIKKIGLTAGVVAFVEVVVMVWIGYFLGTCLGWSFFTSIFLGAGLAISSTTIIVKSLEELNLKGTSFSHLLFGILVMEDVLGILLLVILATVVKNNSLFSFEIVTAAVKLVIIVGGWFVVGYFVIPLLFKKISQYANDETIILTSVALCLGLVCAAAYFDYSLALGAFIMGSILAETPLVHRIETMVHPLRNIFAAVFFVSVGMLIDPLVIVHHLPLILLISAVTIFGKLFASGLGALIAGQNLNTSVRVGLGMSQIGEFAFIIVGLGLMLGVIDDILFPIIVAVSVVTTFTTPYCIRYSQWLADKIDAHIPKSARKVLNTYPVFIKRLSRSSKDQTLYERVAWKVLGNGFAIAIIFFVMEHQALPWLKSLWEFPFGAEALCFFIAMLVSTPLAWGMLTSVPRESPRWLRYGVFLLTALEVLLCAGGYFDRGWWVFAVFCVAMIFFSLSHKICMTILKLIQRVP